MSEYYTPTIEEFHVGFEYDRLVEDHWETLSMSVNFLSLDDIDDEILDKEIRVKHLDREDIESLGFSDFKHAAVDWYKLEKRVDDNFASYGSWNCFRLLHSYTDNGIKIIAYEHSFESDENILFAGKVKNKSELKKILQMIGINQNKEDE